MSLCSTLGHKPVKPLPYKPAYCEYCLKEMSRNSLTSKWVITEQIVCKKFYRLGD
jgi:hypothetical protein